MSFFEYENSPYVIREDIRKEHRTFWNRLAAPGSWWNGTERVAIAREVRNATSCGLCQERIKSLYPQGNHESNRHLPATAVDAIHRIINDQVRITRKYVDGNVKQGLSFEAYVELLGLVVAVFSIDEFHRALGIPLEPMPLPESGDPSHYRPIRALQDVGFVPMLPGDGAVGKEADLWPGDRTANVLRALSLVPDALRDWKNLASAQYLSLPGMSNYVAWEDRSINRMQMELVAGRVSAVNECFY